MDRIARIETMESCLRSALAAVRALEGALAEYEKARGELRALEAYLSSPEWRADLEADEQGLLPASLARGVLSQDGIYTLLEEETELIESIRLLTATGGDAEPPSFL